MTLHDVFFILWGFVGSASIVWVCIDSESEITLGDLLPIIFGAFLGPFALIAVLAIYCPERLKVMKVVLWRRK